MAFNQFARAAVSAVRHSGSDPDTCAVCRAATAATGRDVARATDVGTFRVRVCLACAEVVDLSNALRAAAAEGGQR